MTAKRGAAQGNHLDILVTLVEAWERRHYPLGLIPFIGSRNRVHEVLNRRRLLTLKMVRRLNEGLGIPAESLIKSERKRAA
jgi:HTH-type transcriptional regulator / antitoxin HigA